MEERFRFVLRLLDGEDMSSVCREFGISRKTGYKILGVIVFAVTPLASEFQKYPNVFRSQREQLTVMPVGMVGMFLSMLAVTALYAQIYPAGGKPALGSKVWSPRRSLCRVRIWNPQ